MIDSNSINEMTLSDLKNSTANLDGIDGRSSEKKMRQALAESLGVQLEDKVDEQPKALKSKKAKNRELTANTNKERDIATGEKIRLFINQPTWAKKDTFWFGSVNGVAFLLEYEKWHDVDKVVLESLKGTNLKTIKPGTCIDDGEFVSKRRYTYQVEAA